MDNHASTNSILLSSFFTENDIFLDTMVPSMYNLVHRLVTHIVETQLPEMEVGPIVDAVLRRERVSATVIGTGVALPHARIDGLTRPYMAVGVYPSGIPMVAEEPPVKLIFLLLIPESQPARYLQILRALANALKAPGAVDRLASATSATEVLNFFRRGEMKLPEYICAGDFMETFTQGIRQDTPLSEALNRFMEGDIFEIPVLDEHDRLVGVIDTRALLGCFVPKGFRKLPIFQNAHATSTLEPLATRLRETRLQYVKDAMNTDICVCDIEATGREIAADLAEHNAAVCYIVDKQKRLVGRIPVARFFSRILKD